MPELPDITVYVERLAAYTVGRPLRGMRIVSPFLLRSVDPPPSELIGRTITATSRIGKRLVLHLEGDLHAVIHLMIAGRLRWKAKGAGVPGKVGVAAFDFDHGTLMFTEASPKKRASLTLVRGAAALAEIHRGGVDLLTASTAEVVAALRAENHTIKRSLTDPTIIDGVGNAYSDEILHAAQLSPFRQVKEMTDAELERLHGIAKAELERWIGLLRAEVGEGFPDEVTAFRPEMAVHGKYGQPCPRCGAPVQRIVYADNEANYCAPCQTGGKLLADRGLSRLLKSDWPKTLGELEERKARQRQGNPGGPEMVRPGPTEAERAPTRAKPGSASGKKPRAR